MGQGKQSMQEWEGISRPCPGLKGQAPASGVKSGLSGRVTPGVQWSEPRASLTWPRCLHASNAGCL